MGVAAFPERHPRSPTGTATSAHFVAKCRAGADYAITQMFFHVEDYLRLRDRVAAAGCDTPIIPEIMPATDVRQIRRFAELSGASLPRRAGRSGWRPPRATAAEEATASASSTPRAMADRLLAEGAPGLHYITLNRSTATLEIHRHVSGTRSLHAC